MNRNTKNSIEEITNIIKALQTKAEIADFFKELLTKSELDTIAKRWQILNMLKDGYPQREIAKELKVSLCNITRGAKIIKNPNLVLTKCLTKE